MSIIFALILLFKVYFCVNTIVQSVSPCLRSLVLLRTTKITEYSTLVLYSPRTGNIFSEEKKAATVSTAEAVILRREEAEEEAAEC